MTLQNKTNKITHLNSHQPQQTNYSVNTKQLKQKQVKMPMPPYFPPANIYPLARKSFKDSSIPSDYLLRANNNSTQPDQKQQIECYGNQLRSLGIKLKKSSKKPSQKQQEELIYSQQKDRYDQQNVQKEESSEFGSKTSSINSQINSQTSLKESSVSQHEDLKQQEGFTKFFPKEKEYYYNNDQQEQIINEHREIVKSVMAKGFGLKFFHLYVKQNKVDLNPDLFFQHNSRYYRQFSCVIKKLIHSMQYFLENDCNLNIRKIKIIQYKCIKKQLNNYIFSFSSKYIKTIEKFFKIILNMEDVTISERQVFALYYHIMDKIDKAYQPRQELGAKSHYISDVESGLPYTMRKDRKYTRIYKNTQNKFESLWKDQIEKQFLAIYLQNTSLIYCSEKIRLSYPQYRVFLAPLHLKMHLQRILRGAFGKLKSYMQRLDVSYGNKLPKLSPIDSKVFNKIIRKRNYQKARFVLIRLYNQELNQNNCRLFIVKMNEAIRQFQAFQGMAIIKDQQLTEQFESNVISLRPRLKKKYEVLKEYQQNQSQQEEQNQQKIQQTQLVHIRQSVIQDKQSQFNLQLKGFYQQQD